MCWNLINGTCVHSNIVPKPFHTSTQVTLVCVCVCVEVVVCTDSVAPLWSCMVWELHSGANLLTYRGGQAGPRGLALLNGEYLLAAQQGKNYICAWELQRKVRGLSVRGAAEGTGARQG